MNTTPSSLSLTEMTICLQAIAYSLNTSKAFLSAYEKELTNEFVTTLVESMVKHLEGPITISPSSITMDAITELHVKNELYAVLNALKSMKHGGKETSFSARSNNNRRNTSPDTQAKIIQLRKAQKAD